MKKNLLISLLANIKSIASFNRNHLWVPGILLLIIPVMSKAQQPSEFYLKQFSHQQLTGLRMNDRSKVLKQIKQLDSLYHNDALNKSQVKPAIVKSNEYIVDSSYVYTFSSPTDSAKSGKEIFKYSAAGYDTLTIGYTWDVTPEPYWLNTGEIATSYNSKGNETMFTIFSWDSITNKRIPAVQLDWYYISNGEDTAYYSFSWDTTSNKWIPIFRYSYSFNSSGFQTKTDIYSWNTMTNKFLPWVIDSFFFGTNGIDTVLKSYGYDTTNRTWNLDVKYSYKYSNNYLTTSITWIPNTNTQILTPASETTYSYTSKGIDTSTIISFWDSGTSSWIPESWDRYRFNGSGYDTAHYTYSWDFITDIWTPSDKTTYAYNSSGNTTLTTDYTYATNGWMISDQYVYIYDQNQNLKEYEFYVDTSGNALVINYKQFNYIGLLSAATLSASPTTLNIAAAANSKSSFFINSNTTWTVSSNQTWLGPNPASGSDTATITLTAGANTTYSTRSATVTVSATGVSSVTVSVTQAAAPATGVITLTSENVSLYPIPVKDFLYISLPDFPAQTSIAIYNLNGVELYTSIITNAFTTVDMSKFASGIYIVNIATPNSGTIVKKIIKQ